MRYVIALLHGRAHILFDLGQFQLVIYIIYIVALTHNVEVVQHELVSLLIHIISIIINRLLIGTKTLLYPVLLLLMYKVIAELYFV